MEFFRCFFFLPYGFEPSVYDLQHSQLSDSVSQGVKTIEFFAKSRALSVFFPFLAIRKIRKNIRNIYARIVLTTHSYCWRRRRGIKDINFSPEQEYLYTAMAELFVSRFIYRFTNAPVYLPGTLPFLRKQFVFVVLGRATMYT